MAYPTNYRYTKDHEWIDPSSGKIGVTDFAQKQLGDIVFVELPQVGSLLTPGQEFGTIESVKAVSELFAPVSGKVAQVNEELSAEPEAINEDANNTWLVVVEISDKSELNELLDAAEYEKFIASEQG